jgi:ribokinase
LRLARTQGVTTVLNAAPAAKLDAEVLGLVDVLIVNEHELAIVTGYEDRALALRSARNIVPAVVLTLGPAGSQFIDSSTGDIPVDVRPFPVVAVDTTAAGDAFCGAFAVAVAQGSTTSDAVLRGNAAGAIAATRPGAQPSLPTAVEIDALINRAP